ncbi:MAG: hypothetical protein WCR42_02715 [bacterium]
MKLTLSILILILALLVNINTNASSQTPPCFPEFQGISYQMDDIVNCPPYNSNMPLDVFIGYLSLDSLSKYAQINEYKEFLNRQTYNDTMRTMMRFIYKTVEYNPNTYLSFMYHAKYDKTPIDEYFYCFINKVLDESPSPKLDASLLGSYLIAQITVDSIYSYIDSTSWPISSRLVCCSINQTFKGSSNVNNNNPLIIEPQIKFEYSDEWLVNGNEDSSNVIFELEKNKSYIVFLEYRFVCRSSLDIYYTIYPFRSSYSKTACMYPIVNGNVIDTFNELGFGTSVNLNIFNAGLTNRINAIKNYTP